MKSSNMILRESYNTQNNFGCASYVVATFSLLVALNYMFGIEPLELLQAIVAFFSRLINMF